MLTEERKEQRRAGIGGSDIAAVLGVSPYATPLDVYRLKLGLDEGPDLSANEAVHFGNVLEDVVAEEFARRTGLKVRRNNRLLSHPERPYLLANIDREVVGRLTLVVDGEAVPVKAGLECKTTDKWAARPELWGPGAELSVADGRVEVVRYDDQVPEWYLLQCAHYMAVTGADVWFLAVLIGGNDFRVYTIRRDPELEALVVDHAEKFWTEHVQQGNPPPATRLSDVEAAYPQDNGEAIVADAEILGIVERIKLAKAAMAEIEKELKGEKVGKSYVGGLETALKAYMGDSAELLTDDAGRVLATWKSPKPSQRFDVTAFKAAHPDLYQQFTTEVASGRRLLIK